VNMPNTISIDKFQDLLGTVDQLLQSVRQSDRAVEMTTLMVMIDFLMSDLTRENGPIREIPSTNTAQQPYQRQPVNPSG